MIVYSNIGALISVWEPPRRPDGIKVTYYMDTLSGDLTILMRRGSRYSKTTLSIMDQMEMPEAQIMVILEDLLTKLNEGEID